MNYKRPLCFGTYPDELDQDIVKEHCVNFCTQEERQECKANTGKR